MDKVSLNTEAAFGIEELFISKTDKKGIIKFGNDVFTRISGYTVDELIGSSHNIVRHPDMPKGLFKLLWETIKSGEPIAAYVKNLSKDGSYYWVFASVYPVADGYFSIRLKPTLSIREEVARLYQEMLEIEASNSVINSCAHLNASIKKLGYNDYIEFMAVTFANELESRRASLLANPIRAYFQPGKALPSEIVHLYHTLELSLDNLYRNGSLIEKMKGMKNRVEDCLAKISNLSNKVESVATNMSISAHRIGRDGATLAVVAHQLQSTLKTLNGLLGPFIANSKMIESQTSHVLFGYCATQLQAEMIVQFLQEKMKAGTDKVMGTTAEIRMLLETLTNLFGSNIDRTERFHIKVDETYRLALGLLNCTTKIDLIYSGGRLESSRTQEMSSIFKPHLDLLFELAGDFFAPTSDISSYLKEMRDLSSIALRAAVKTKFLLEESHNSLKYHMGETPKGA